MHALRLIVRDLHRPFTLVAVLRDGDAPQRVVAQFEACRMSGANASAFRVKRVHGDAWAFKEAVSQLLEGVHPQVPPLPL